LDFFVNNDSEYAEQMKFIFAKFREDDFFWDTESDFISHPAFTSLKIQWKKSDAVLKLDFVNDIAAHFGTIEATELFDRTDSPRNILSNKITALFRYEGKDVADIREIALHESFDWTEIIREAREKENGLEIPVICEIIKGMPQDEFDRVKWTQKPTWSAFSADIDRIVFEMISGKNE
jgi:hypothetical protein